MPTYTTINLTEADNFSRTTTAGSYRVNGRGGNDIIMMAPPSSSRTPDGEDYLDGAMATIP